ncbi:hypothetical protein AYL99_02700 [Fonsecaea erecta]|uniref:Uncharacterized protein n=1 Tax=Fonsecaea erecta TaxID=1367422 RepID=A0A178ZW47_9EURO|nr:hypothetical protein AYL99_02700 [Fonsecaea erecta]OAP63473.1 hypothetical protein AYL99_02700 [Fonsecaea erecta]
MERYDELKQWRRSATTDAGEDALEGWRMLRETKMTSMVSFHQRLVLEYICYGCVISLEKASRLQNTLYKDRVARSILDSSRRYAIDQLAADSLEGARSMCIDTAYRHRELRPKLVCHLLSTHRDHNPFLAYSDKPDVGLCHDRCCVYPMCAGMFGRIEYLFSESILLTKSEEFAKTASTIVDRAKNHEAGDSRNNISNTISNDSNRDIPSQQAELVQPQQWQQQQQQQPLQSQY